MATKATEIRQMTERLKAMSVEDRAKVLHEILTPGVELRMVAESMWQRTRKVPTRTLNRAIDRAVREVRRERAARAAR